MTGDSGTFTSTGRVENRRLKYEKIFRRINKFRKYMIDMRNSISQHAVKVANLRDKNDEVARCLEDFENFEEFSTTSKLSLAIAAKFFREVGDHQDLVVQRVETLVLPNLCLYTRICDCIKADVWNAIQAIRREKRKRKYFKALSKKSHDPKTKYNLNDAQRELERASAETARFCDLSEEQVIKFEHKRLMDLKESLGTFVKIQIAGAAKSLEILSKTFKQIQSIDENEDIEILKASLGIQDKSKAKKKSSTTLKQKRSQKSLSASGSSSVKLKEGNSSSTKYDNKKADSDSEETSDSAESFHSGYVRNLENVLHSNYEVREKKQGKHGPSSRESLSRERQGKHRNNDEENTRKEKFNLKRSSDSSIHKNHSYDEPRTGSKKRGNERQTSLPTPRSAQRHGSKQSKSHKDSNFSDEEYSSFKSKMLGKRPSTPPKPLTVPQSSTEDLSSRRDDFVFNKNKKQYVTKKDVDAYYYSQSEDDKLRKQSDLGSKKFKHVSFYQHPSDYHDDRSGKRVTTLSVANYNDRSPRKGAGDLMRYNEPTKRTFNPNATMKQPLRSYC